MRFPRVRRSWRMVAGAVMIAALLQGCGEPGSTPAGQDRDAEPTPDEVAAHDGVCPSSLPQGDGSDHGLGTDAVADSAPSLPVPERAWVCVYQPVRVGPGPDGNGTAYGWRRDGRARTVARDALAHLKDDLDALAPPRTSRVGSVPLT
jgi:hypothetical protein